MILHDVIQTGYCALKCQHSCWPDYTCPLATLPMCADRSSSSCYPTVGSTLI